MQKQERNGKHIAPSCQRILIEKSNRTEMRKEKTKKTDLIDKHGNLFAERQACKQDTKEQHPPFVEIENNQKTKRFSNN
jgi:hypothetical protein